MGMVPAAVLGILVGTIVEGGFSAVGNRFGTSLEIKHILMRLLAVGI